MIDLSNARWRKSVRSGGQEACVEVANQPLSVAVRDSKDPDGPKLVLSRGAWRLFTEQVRRHR